MILCTVFRVQCLVCMHKLSAAVFCWVWHDQHLYRDYASAQLKPISPIPERWTIYATCQISSTNCTTSNHNFVMSLTVTKSTQNYCVWGKLYNRISHYWNSILQRAQQSLHALPGTYGAPRLELSFRIQCNQRDCKLALPWQLIALFKVVSS